MTVGLAGLTLRSDAIDVADVSLIPQTSTTFSCRSPATRSLVLVDSATLASPYARAHAFLAFVSQHDIDAKQPLRRLPYHQAPCI